MILTKLKVSAAAMLLGIVAAGAIVSAQQPKDEHTEIFVSATTETRPPRAIPAKQGNFFVDWITAGGPGGKQQVTVDPTRHSVHLPWSNQKRDDRPNDGAVRVDLERGKFYKITASGEAFMTEQTGNDADPFPGVFVQYPTDEEDCFALRQIVLAPGKSVAFRAPWLIQPTDEVFLLAFFLDCRDDAKKRGHYTLTIEETGEPAAQADTTSGTNDVIIFRKR
jgi:hypothetical protein